MAPDSSPALAVERAALERCAGRVELTFGRRGGRTRLVHLFQQHPCRALFPRVDPGEPATAVMVTTSGGLTGGDRVSARVALGAGAAAVVAAQAAEKIYRALDAPCAIDVALTVGEDAWCEWLPQETILFDGARLKRHTVIDVAPGGRCLAVEMVVFGRTARGESFSRGGLFDRREVRRAGRLAWVDAMALDGDIAALLARPAAFDGARACASALYIADAPETLLDAARAHLAAAPVRTAVTVVNGILVARFMGAQAHDVRRALGDYVAVLRAAAAGLPPALPRVWAC